MTFYYLNTPVRIVEAPNVEGRLASEFGEGWVNCLWPPEKKGKLGKVYTHWIAQLVPQR